MKGIKTFGVVLAMSFLVACNDDISDPDSGKNNAQAVGGYVKVAINMPTTSGNMMGRSASYDNGDPNEYEVKDACIVFFGGTEESDATFLKAYDLGLKMNQAGDNEGQITTTSDAYVMEAPLVPKDKKLYALVVVNPNGIFEVEDGKLKIDGGSELDESATLANLQMKMERSERDFIGDGNTKGFFMTNAPLWNSSDNKATTLVEVQVYDSKEKAQASKVADQIYVERIVAKVSLEAKANESGEFTVGENSAYSGDKVTLKDWVLNVTNKSTNIVRNVSGLEVWMEYDEERFVETSMVKKGTNLYRINWAIDHNYREDYNEGDFNYKSESVSWEESWKEGKVNYCLENTFNVDHQRKNQTTSVLIKATYNRKENAEPQDFFIVGDNGVAISEEDFLKMVGEVLPELKGKITVKNGAKGGYYNVAGGKTLNDLLSSDGMGDVLEKVNETLGEVKYYKDGTTYYYTTLIRHFDDEETPWKGEEYEDAKHLGRYGVVRNTWYQLIINKILGPGEPEIPEIPDEPDDTVEGYIQVEVNTLSWAVRTQGVVL